jgi:hypothetical protein
LSTCSSRSGFFEKENFAPNQQKLRDELEGAYIDIKRKRRENKELHLRNAAMDRKLEEMQKKIDELSASRRDAFQMLAEVQQDRDARRKQLADKEKEIQSLQRRYNLRLTAAVGQSPPKVIQFYDIGSPAVRTPAELLSQGRLAEELELLRTKTAEQEDIIADLTEQLSATNALAEEVTEAAARHGTEMKKSRGIVQENFELKKGNAELEADLESLRIELNQHQDQLLQATARTEAAELSQDKLREEYAQANAVRSEHEAALKQRIAELEMERKAEPSAAADSELQAPLASNTDLVKLVEHKMGLFTDSELGALIASTADLLESVEQPLEREESFETVLQRHADLGGHPNYKQEIKHLEQVRKENVEPEKTAKVITWL